MPDCCIENCKRGFCLLRVLTGDRREEWHQLIDKETLLERAIICEI